MPVHFPTHRPEVSGTSPLASSSSSNHPVFQPAFIQGDALASSAKKADEGLFTRIWNSITSFFSWICCCSSSSNAGEIKELEQMKQILSNAKADFIKKRAADQTADKKETKSWWADKFAKFPKEVQKRLVDVALMEFGKYELEDRWQQACVAMNPEDRAKVGAGDKKLLEKHGMALDENSQIVPSEEGLKKYVKEQKKKDKGTNDAYSWAANLVLLADPNSLLPVQDLHHDLDKAIAQIEKEIKALG